MPNTTRDYFNNKVPVQPATGVYGPPAPRTWQQALGHFSRTMFKTLPDQLDRTRVNRNRFLSAVK